MPIALGEDDDFAGFDRDRFRADHAGEATPFGDHMIGDQVLGARQDLQQHHLARRLLGNPGCPGRDVEVHRARQPHRAQDVG